MIFASGVPRVCLRSAYFVEIENFLLKVLQIKVKLAEIVQQSSMNSTKSAVGPINNSKNKLNSKISQLFKMSQTHTTCLKREIHAIPTQNMSRNFCRENMSVFFIFLIWFFCFVLLVIYMVFIYLFDLLCNSIFGSF